MSNTDVTDKFFPVNPENPAYFDFPQSELFKRMEARTEFLRAQGLSEPEFVPEVKEHKTAPLFPASADQLIVWGLDGVLVNFSSAMEGAYKQRTIDSLRKTLGPKAVIDEDQVRALVHKGYVDGGQPCKYVASEYGVNEGDLQIDMMSRVAYEDIALNPSKYGTGDQGLLNYFEASRARGNPNITLLENLKVIKHAVITSASGNLAKTALNFSSLDQYIDRVIASDNRRNNVGAILPKNKNPDQFLDAAFPAAEFGDRYPSITVVDHNLDFLAAAQARGMKTVLLDRDQKFAVKPSEADYMVCAPHKVFEKVLGIKDPGTHRDLHVYAGVGAFLPSPK